MPTSNAGFSHYNTHAQDHIMRAMWQQRVAVSALSDGVADNVEKANKNEGFDNILTNV